MNLQFLSSVVLSFVRVTGSVVTGEHGAVLLGGEGAVSDVDDPLGDGSSDKFTDAEQLGSLGLVVRPRPPEAVGGKQLGAEGIGARLGGSTVPIALRDLRLNRRFGAPKPGSVALVGYGGGFAAFDDTTSISGSEKASKFTLYVPYEFSGGVPTKAHVFYFDPDSDAIGLVHGEGMALVLNGSDKSATLRIDSTSYLTAKPGELFLNFTNVIINGNAVLGGTVGAPLLPGIASPPSTKVFIAP